MLEKRSYNVHDNFLAWEAYISNVKNKIKKTNK